MLLSLSLSERFDDCSTGKCSLVDLANDAAVDLFGFQRDTGSKFVTTASIQL
jgi:hypothetical protein